MCLRCHGDKHRKKYKAKEPLQQEDQFLEQEEPTIATEAENKLDHQTPDNAPDDMEAHPTGTKFVSLLIFYWQLAR